ncbi:MAG: DsbA family protein [Patescibacteria group bacterium]
MLEQPSELITKPKWYRRPWVLVGAIVLILWFGIPAALDLFTGKSLPESRFTSLPGNQAGEVGKVNLATSDDPAQGSPSAPVVIVEFGDFQCPFCQQESFILHQLLQEYPDAVRLIYRDFPVSSIHTEAFPAAVAANCALKQDKFWEYHDQLYQLQDQLGSDLYNSLASTLGLDQNQFSTCLSSPQISLEIEEDFEAGIQAGVKGTPTFFVNNQRVEGAVPYDLWVKIISSEVARKFNE